MAFEIDYAYILYVLLSVTENQISVQPNQGVNDRPSSKETTPSLFASTSRVFWSTTGQYEWVCSSHTGVRVTASTSSHKTFPKTQYGQPHAALGHAYQ